MTKINNFVELRKYILEILRYFSGG